MLISLISGALIIGIRDYTREYIREYIKEQVKKRNRERLQEYYIVRALAL